MSKIKILLEILVKSFFKPKLMKDILNERAQTQDDAKFKNHKYDYDYNSIDEYLSEVYPEHNIENYKKEFEILEKHTKEFFNKLELEKFPSKKKPYPIDYSINHDSRKFLYILCRIIKPKNVIETGVAYGLSSLYILKSLKDNTFGTLHSIDSIFRPWQSVKMIGAVIPKDFRNKWDLEIGKSVDKLPYLLNKFQDTDIFIHDSLHTYQNMMFEFNITFEKIKKNGMIVSDDILSNDAFYNFVTEKKLKNFIIKVDEGVGLGIIIKS
jgi:hypothetical protein